MVTLNGSVKIDPTLTHYYGNSLGGVMGEVYMASTTNVVRGKSLADSVGRLERGGEGGGRGREGGTESFPKSLSLT